MTCERQFTTPRRCLVLLLTFGASLSAFSDAPVKAQALPKKVLFVCSGNYYRSRFAEAVFNDLATRSPDSVWKAGSRGLHTASAPKNHPVSPLVVAELARVGIAVDDEALKRYPVALAAEDVRDADLIVLLNRPEHEAPFKKMFPDVPAAKLEYWNVADVNETPAKVALPEISKKVGELFARLRSGGHPWRLVYEETFDHPIEPKSTSWRKAQPGSEDPFDDDGKFFHAMGGEEFAKQLRSFDTYRKTFSFGKDHWLTAELSARDPEKTGGPKDPPTLTLTQVEGRSAALLSEPEHHGGILIRSTRPLPAHYRIEYTLAAIDFGGTRGGKWAYSGKLNGYDTRGSKTRHPWPFGKSDEFAKPYADWLDTRFANGFYYLGILDYPDPFPRNNVFIHTHRKVVMDSYVVTERAAFETCNPATRKYYVSQDNTVNMLFMAPGNDKETQSVMETECGVAFGSEGGRAPVVSAVELQPELMPAQKYRFAIERDDSGYTLEIQGDFRFVGQKTYRYHRAFVQDGHPIWHYNRTPQEYDGSYDRSWNVEGPFGKYAIEHSWPKGSAYPDYFIIGDPHTNYYEGSATIQNIRLYEAP